MNQPGNATTGDAWAQVSNGGIALPSILALAPLRPRARQLLREAGSKQSVARAVLGLDPLTTLRCLRVAHAPLQAPSGSATTIARLVDILGPTLVQRAFDVPVTAHKDSEYILRAWRHAVATAIAARSLATARGVFEPGEAHLLGLLHDLRLWHKLLTGMPHRPGSAETAEFAQHWNLPSRLLELSFGAAGQTLIRAARALAEAAGCWARRDGPSRVLASFLPDLGAAVLGNLKEEIELTLAPLRTGDDASTAPEEALFGHRQDGEVGEISLALMEGKDATTYGGIRAMATAAVQRYLGFDRVYLFTFAQAEGMLWLRTKMDLLRGTGLRTWIRVVDPELKALREALEGTPRLLSKRTTPCATGLLQHLGSDEVLVVALNREFSTPSLLVMDRALSGRKITSEDNLISARTLAMTASLVAENLLLRRRRERAQRFALTDPLTRLYNRVVGIANLQQEISRARRHQQPLSVLMIDIDNFKRLNDQNGHVVGDMALRRTAEVLRRTLRKGDIICRYGGEEFLAVLPATSVEEASIIATRLFTAVEEQGDELCLPLTISIGLAALRPEDTDTEVVLTRADHALYASKSMGRNRFSVET